MQRAFKRINRLGKHAVTLCTAFLLLAPALPATAIAQTAPASKTTGKTQQKPKNFDGLTCQSDIAAELAGRKMTNGKVEDIEVRYKSLQLSYRGGHGMPEDPYVLGFWVICGKDFVVQEASKAGIVQRVLVAPAPSSEIEMAVGSCKTAAGKKLDYVIFARAAAQKKGPWNVSAAWTIREPKHDFVPLTDSGLTCQ